MGRRSSVLFLGGEMAREKREASSPPGGKGDGGRVVVRPRKEGAVHGAAGRGTPCPPPCRSPLLPGRPSLSPPLSSLVIFPAFGVARESREGLRGGRRTGASLPSSHPLGRQPAATPFGVGRCCRWVPPVRGAPAAPLGRRRRRRWRAGASAPLRVACRRRRRLPPLALGRSTDPRSCPGRPPRSPPPVVSRLALGGHGVGGAAFPPLPPRPAALLSLPRSEVGGGRSVVRVAGRVRSVGPRGLGGGPVRSRASSAADGPVVWRCSSGGAAGRRRVARRGVWRSGVGECGGGRRLLSPLPPFLLPSAPPVQVPSAFRRGGLKTPGGPVHSPGAGVVERVSRAAPRRGDRREGGCPAAVAGRARVPRAAPSCLRWGGWRPPGACGGRPGLAPLAGFEAPRVRPPVLVKLLAASAAVSVLSAGRSEATPFPAPAGVEGDVPCPWRRGAPAPRPSQNLVRLLAVDHSARASMKNAASCEN